ncbi:hypothetical protein [Tritonibacter mobilis]|uniref:hypothetical protein n=1 Tax=Tritonibacter mobilis TaxID=379347 RepID=UPI001CD98EFE|nr:hypothetical protein [Tritonibacter mobilis]MCA2008525.1 hypothetical protein [Tritonibacter mobilis]
MGLALRQAHPTTDCSRPFNLAKLLYAQGVAAQSGIGRDDSIHGFLHDRIGLSGILLAKYPRCDRFDLPLIWCVMRERKDLPPSLNSPVPASTLSVNERCMILLIDEKTL